MTPITLSAVEIARFWTHVRKQADGCWLWMAHRLDYRGEQRGRVSVRGKVLYASRVAWVAEYGPIPAGLHVLHRCDTPLCVRPEHLFLGTQSDNVRDAVLKGRWDRSGEHNRHKLTRARVANIRASRRTNRQLADAYGVNISTIRQARLGLTWR